MVTIMRTPGLAALVLIVLITGTVLAGGCLNTGTSATSSTVNNTSHTTPVYPTSNDTLKPPELEEMATINNLFASELYGEFSSREGNVFFSPYSILTALSIAYEGAKGKTAEEMAKVLHLPKDDLERREGFRMLILRLNNPASDAYILSTANALWVQKDFPIKETYIEVVKKYYLSEVKEVDFQKNPEGAALQINRWAEEKTRGRIKNLVSSLDPLTRLVIANAIYFKANWSSRFSPANTRNGTFYAPNGAVVVPMMHQTGRFGYFEGDDFKALEMPYEDGRLSMLIILPEKGSIGKVEKRINPEFIQRLLRSMKAERVKVTLPKFKFETSYKLKDTLMKMGVREAFSNSADFTGISDGSLAISQVIHKTFISVAENGTEAAAATALTITALAPIGEEVKVFKADHPFIFLIYDRESGAILFMGRLVDPRG